MESNDQFIHLKINTLFERVQKVLDKEKHSLPALKDNVCGSETESDNDSDSDVIFLGKVDIPQSFQVSIPGTLIRKEEQLIYPSVNEKQKMGEIQSDSQPGVVDQIYMTQILEMASSSSLDYKSDSLSITKNSRNSTAESYSMISMINDDDDDDGCDDGGIDFPALSSKRIKFSSDVKSAGDSKTSGSQPFLQLGDKNGAFHKSAEILEQPTLSVESKSVKKRKTKEEREQEKEDKKKTKEMEKLAKASAKLEEKQRKAKEAASKKRLLEMEKATKKAASMTAKAESTDQCLKYITVVLDPDLLSDGGGKILESLDSMTVQYEIKTLPVQSTVGWMRDHVKYVVQDDCQIKRTSDFKEEKEILMRLKADEFARMVEAQMGKSKDSNPITVLQCISNAEQRLPDKRITILITGMQNYLKMIKAKSTSKTKKKDTSLAFITKDDIEEVLLQVELRFSCCVHFCETAEELAQMVAMVTKAVAEKPYKRTPGIAFNIYMNNHDRDLPRVTDDGQGLLEVWVRQLQQFKGVGRDTAAAVVDRYPSPLILMQAYEKCSTEMEAKKLLQDIEVRRGHGVLATSRRVGPELSRKIHELMTSLDGDKELAKS